MKVLLRCRVTLTTRLTTVKRLDCVIDALLVKQDSQESNMKESVARAWEGNAGQVASTSLVSTR